VSWWYQPYFKGVIATCDTEIRHRVVTGRCLGQCYDKSLLWLQESQALVQRGQGNIAAAGLAGGML
jgi:hypothetical protein